MARPLRPRAAAIALAALGVSLAACGKTSTPHAAAGGPAKSLSPVSKPGAVSVATRNTTRVGGGDVTADAAAIARTVYPGLTSESRPRAVVLANPADYAGSLAAAALAGGDVAAPLLFGEAGSLPAVTRETLAALRPAGVSALGGAQVLRVGSVAVPAGLLVRAVAPASPAQEAAAVANLLVTAAGTHAPRAAIVVSAQAPPQMTMPAAGLAAESGVPILFTEAGGVPAVTRGALEALRHPAIYVIDAASVGTAALAQLGRLGTTTTVSSGAGEDATPAANAIAVARYTNGTFGWGVKEPGHGLVLASAARPLDAPAAASLSATGDYAPLLLLEGPTQVPAPLATYLGDIQPAYTSAPQFRPVRGVYNHGWLIGDESAVSAVTQAQIDALLEISPRRQSAEEAAVQQAE
jgi:hypothetical protein